eukprot:g7474.t1
MAPSLHQIARRGVVEEGESFFREVTDSKGEQAANAVDGMQRTPLHLACWAGKAGMIDLLLKHRADCMALAQDGFTPLHFCSQAGCAQGCRLLLGAGAKVDAKLLKTKKTPLHFAAGKGHLEAVRVLMQAGAEVSSETSKGQTPMHLAAKHPEVVAALAGERPPTPTPVMTSTVSVTAPAEAGGENPAAEVAAAAVAETTQRPTEGAGGDTALPGAGSGGARQAEELAGKGEEQGPEAKGQGSSAPGAVEGGAVGRVGSLAERRRKKRKLAKAAAASGGKGVGVSLSHLDGDGGDGDGDDVA